MMVNHHTERKCLINISYEKHYENEPLWWPIEWCLRSTNH